MYNILLAPSVYEKDVDCVLLNQSAVHMSLRALVYVQAFGMSSALHDCGVFLLELNSVLVSLTGPILKGLLNHVILSQRTG